MTLEWRDIDGDMHARANTEEDVAELAEEVGSDDVASFYREYGITFNDIKGKYVFVFGPRISIEERLECSGCGDFIDVEDQTSDKLCTSCRRK